MKKFLQRRGMAYLELGHFDGPSAVEMMAVVSRPVGRSQGPSLTP